MALESKLSLEEERALIERARNGDGEAFGAIYDAYKNTLFQTVIFPRLRDEKAAEEVLQDTFLMALGKIGAFEWRDRSIFFWLRMIAINKCREHISKSIRHSTVDGAVLDYQSDTSYQPEDAVVVEDFSRILGDRIEEVLGTINKRYASAVIMRLKEKQSREECADALGVTIETFDVVFFRACKSFREAYIKKYGEL